MSERTERNLIKDQNATAANAAATPLRIADTARMSFQHIEVFPTTSKTRKETMGSARISKKTQQLHTGSTHYMRPRKPTFHPPMIQTKLILPISKPRPLTKASSSALSMWYLNRLMERSSSNQRTHTLDWGSRQEVSSLLPWNLHQRRLPRWLRRYLFYHFKRNDSQSGKEPIKTPTDEHNCVPEATQAKTNSSCTQRSVNDDPRDNANTTKQQKTTKLTAGEIETPKIRLGQ